MEVAHPPAKVSAALTTAEGLGAWFGNEATIDLRPGGAALDAVTRQITDAGGRATYAVVDTLDGTAVDSYLSEVAERAGRIDIELNATGPRVTDYGTGTPATELPIDQFLAAQDVLPSQFITARCAARRMVTQGAGVIIFLTGSPARPHFPGAAAIGAAFGGIENLTRLMALELSGTGVRVVCLRTAANPDSRTIQELADATAADMHITKEQVLGSLAESTMLKVSPLTEDPRECDADGPQYVHNGSLHGRMNTPVALRDG